MAQRKRIVYKLEFDEHTVEHFKDPNDAAVRKDWLNKNRSNLRNVELKTVEEVYDDGKPDDTSE